MNSDSPNPPGFDTVAVVLAAGLGKRFRADRPKVLFEFHGRPLVLWVTDALKQAGIRRVILIVGFKGKMVERAYAGQPVEIVWQREQLGTGHAVRQAEPLLCPHHGQILVLLGDAPCIRPGTINELLRLHTQSGAAATILSAEVPDPTGYGRVVRAADGTVDRIVEHRDADDKTRAIKEINSGTICFSAEHLFPALSQVTNTNDQKEYYLTDVIAILRAAGRRVMAYLAPDYREVLGVNSPSELAALVEATPRFAERGKSSS